MHTRILLLIIILVGCIDSIHLDLNKPISDAILDSADEMLMDQDGDGITIGQGDCDDSDPTISPLLMEEPYDGVDNDCNPETLDDDLDQDGYPLAEDCNDLDADVYSLCPTDEDGDGFSPEDGDCNDHDPNIYPDHPDDNCDNLDNNCNREFDENWSGDQQENDEALQLNSSEDIYLVGYTFPDNDVDQFILETNTMRTIDIEPGHELNIKIEALINEIWVEVVTTSSDEMFSFEIYPEEFQTTIFKIELYSETGYCTQPYELQIGFP
jgi:hypothetical protein